MPAITLSRASDENADTLEQELAYSEQAQGNISFQTCSGTSSPTQSPTRKLSPEGTDPETSDWLSQSSSSPISSYNEKLYEPQTSDLPEEAEEFIKETISKQVEEHIDPSYMMSKQESQVAHGSRIPVRVKSDKMSNGTVVRELDTIDSDQGVTSRKISIKVQRPRSPSSIMAEARARQEQDRERKKLEKVEQERQKKEERSKDEPVMTGSASEGADLETEPMKSDEDDLVKDKTQNSVTVNLQNSTQMNGEIRNGVPVFVMPGKNHDMELLLEALRHARNEANMQDQLMQNANPDNPEFREVVDKNIQQLEAQLAAVKAQSKELFEDRANQKESMSRGRPSLREPGSAARNGRHSPPRGILDMMVNQNIHPEETIPKHVTEERSSPHSILRNRRRSPIDSVRRFNEDSSKFHDESQTPDSRRSMPPFENGSGEDADKRLIKFLTNEIENMKLKMAVMEQKNNQRSQSPYSVGPQISKGLPERDRSPAQISSRARARFTSDDNLNRYSPARGPRSEFLDDYGSSSPRFGSPARSLSRSPARSPASVYRSRTPDKGSRERTRPISPSARVLSLQDLSTSINDDTDGNLTFSPASGAKPVNLGYSSPIRRVNEEIWGYGQTDDEYYADTAKYEGWKKLISRDAVTDEDNLELKQALASALVELNIVQAKLKNANSDIKDKMAKTTEVLNDCRAQISKSQAENAELRTQIEREKSKSEAQELRIKEMEQNLHSAKTNQDDKTLELEESLLTLKGKFLMCICLPDLLLIHPSI